MSEPTIIVNGVQLTESQACAVRVAITSFHKEVLDPNHLGEDRLGRAITNAYKFRTEEVLKLMIK